MSGNEASDLLGVAQGGDRRAFDALTSPHRRAIVGHCYRMLGASHDADDATQESLLRAWRHVGGYEGRASLRGWLYAIATRVCLDALERRGARRLPSFDDSASADPAVPPGEPVLDPVWIDPIPDAAWCDGEVDGFEAPDAAVTLRQSVALAFLAAIQMLPASQRAAHWVSSWRARLRHPAQLVLMGCDYGGCWWRDTLWVLQQQDDIEGTSPTLWLSPTRRVLKHPPLESCYR